MVEMLEQLTGEIEADFANVERDFKTKSIVVNDERCDFVTIANGAIKPEGERPVYASTPEEALACFRQGWPSIRASMPGKNLYWRVMPAVEKCLGPSALARQDERFRQAEREGHSDVAVVNETDFQYVCRARLLIR